MYICTCHKLTLSDGSVARYGEKVPEAAKWSESVRRANLRLGYITHESDFKAPATTTAKEAKAPSASTSPKTGDATDSKNRRAGKR